MDVKERLQEDMKSAMKAREAGRVRLSVIRMARAAIKNAEIERRHGLDDGEVLEVLARELKLRRESLEEFRRAGRSEAVRSLEEEIAVLEEYLPQQLGEAEIRERAGQVIAEIGAVGPGDLGKVMSTLMPQVRGLADGKEVNRIVRELLS